MRPLRRLMLLPLVRAWRGSRSTAVIPRPDAGASTLVHAPGGDADRVLLFGAGPAAGWGVRSHDLGLAGGIARALARKTGRGVDVDLRVDPDIRADRATAALSGLRLWRYDAVVLALGVNDALDLTPRSRWRIDLTRAIDAVLEAGSRNVRVMVLGIQPIRSIPIFDSWIGGLIAIHARRINEVTRGLCEERGDVTFIDMPAPPPEPNGAYRSRLGYEEWGVVIADALAGYLDAERRADAMWHVDPESDWSHLVRETEGRIPPLVRTAASLAGMPYAAFAVANGDVIWASTFEGTLPQQVPRGPSFTAETMRTSRGLIVPDVLEDPRFRNNPAVVGPPSLRFFAGYPVHAPTGEPIGALCLFDSRSHPVDWIDMSQLRHYALLIERELSRRPDR